MRPTPIAGLILGIVICFHTTAAPTVGAMSGEIRDWNERIDIPRTIDALTQLKVNTYYYLIWQNSRDWEDFPRFLDAARQRNIEVWAYIVPWSESPPNKKNGWGYSEPFRNDYIRWAEEIAKLSRNFPNLVGYVIDDFYDNTTEGRFTPKYVRQMVQAGKRINPKLKFFPLMYFQTPWVEFTNRFSDSIDGVVICYPKSSIGVRNAVNYLKDRRHGPSAIITLPRKHGAARGDGAVVSTDVNIADPDNAEISFYYDVTDDVEGDRGLQDVRVLVNGRVIWNAPTEGRFREGVVTIDLARIVRRPGRIKLDLEVITRRTGVPEKLPVVVRFDDIRITGTTERFAPYPVDLDLRGKPAGKFLIDVLPGGWGQQRYDIPVVLMPPGEGEQYEKRYDTRGTPQAIADKVRMSLDLINTGQVDGVVPYRIYLDPRDRAFTAIQREFEAFLSGARREE